MYVALTLPARVYELMPIAVLIGTLYALATWRRTPDHRDAASGMSNALLMSVLGLIGGVFAVLIFLVGEYVAPPAEAAAGVEAHRHAGDRLATTALGPVGEGRLARAQRAHADARPQRLRGARIYAFDEDYALESIAEAATGVSTAAGSGSCSTCSVRASTAIAPAERLPEIAGVRS